MEFRPLRLNGCYEIVLDPQHDNRGYFVRTFDARVFNKYGLVDNWIQDNQSCSIQLGTVRGLHFQMPPYAETKLVRAVVGKIFDVFVDLRKDSDTYSQWESVELSAGAFNMVYIPKGFAHGYCSLTENAIVSYKVDSPYTPESESGLRWNDESLGILWPVHEPHISPKDRELPLFRQFVSPFTLSIPTNFLMKEEVNDR